MVFSPKSKPATYNGLQRIAVRRKSTLGRKVTGDCFFMSCLSKPSMSRINMNKLTRSLPLVHPYKHHASKVSSYMRPLLTALPARYMCRVCLVQWDDRNSYLSF